MAHSVPVATCTWSVDKRECGAAFSSTAVILYFLPHTISEGLATYAVVALCKEESVVGRAATPATLPNSARDQQPACSSFLTGAGKNFPTQHTHEKNLRAVCAAIVTSQRPCGAMCVCAWSGATLDISCTDCAPGWSSPRAPRPGGGRLIYCPRKFEP